MAPTTYFYAIVRPRVSFASLGAEKEHAQLTGVDPDALVHTRQLKDAFSSLIAEIGSSAGDVRARQAELCGVAIGRLSGRRRARPCILLYSPLHGEKT
jgi:hypothetical protein